MTCMIDRNILQTAQRSFDLEGCVSSEIDGIQVFE